jgi:glucosylceramidase
MTILSQMTAAQKAEFGAAIAVNSFTPTPSALRTAVDLSTMAASTAMTAFAPIAGLPAAEIVVDPTETYQQMYGAGAALTESTCYMLSTYCTPAQRRSLLTQVFNADGFNTCRIQMGASDFTWRGTSGYYTYCDDWDGIDATLPTFTIQKDLEYIIPALRETLTINPRLKFIASPWSPPALMKSINSLIGTVGGVGNLFVGSTTNYTAYANYFVKFLQAYKALGIPVWAVTVQNEPAYGPDSYPGCIWSGTQMQTFIGTYLGPALAAAGLSSVKILTHDHNWNTTVSQGSDLVLAPLTDFTGGAGGYTTGSAWHGYSTSGKHEFEAQRAKNPFPGKEIHVTEFCSVWNKGATPNTAQLDFRQHLANCIIGAIRAGANSVTFWNLFLDANGKPFAPSYAVVRPAAYLSTDGTATMSRTASYMSLLHLLKVMKPGAKRCRSTTFGVGESDFDVQTVAFANPDGSVGVLLFNNGAASKTVSVVDAPSGFASLLTLAAGDVVSVNYSVPTGSVATGSILPPGAVPTLNASGANGIATLNWGAATAADAAGISGYLIRRSTTSGTETLTVGAAGPSDTTFTDVDVVVGTAYFYQVFAISAGGLSASAPEASAAVAAGKPGTPTITVTPGNAQNTVTLGKAPPSNGAAITQYNLYRSTTSGAETLFQSNVSLTNGQYVDTSLTNGTAYYYTMTAVNSAGEGPQSTEKSGVPATLPKPDKGLLVDNDMGANVQTPSNGTPTGGWSITDYTFANATAAVSNHNAVIGPDGVQSDASTLTFTNNGTTSGYASVDCATTGNPGTGTLTASVYLRGKVGGETLQMFIANSTHQGGNTGSGVTKITLTTSWVKYTTTASISNGASVRAIFNIGYNPNTFNGSMSFDAAWPSLTN